MKVGGSSVVQALGEYCGEDDVINTPCIKDVIKQRRSINRRNFELFFPHMPVDEVKRVANIDWDSFFKITTVRNPWDMTVSMYWTFVIDMVKPVFSEWLETCKIYPYMTKRNNYSNISEKEVSFANCEDYYFKDGERIADHYLRYENLESDYEKLCYRIGIPYRKLPKIRADLRTDKKHYSNYYDENTIELVAKMFPQIIKEFGYKFESNMADRITL